MSPFYLRNFSHLGLVKDDANSCGDTFTVYGVHLVEMHALTLLDFLGALTEEATYVGNDGIAIFIIKNLVPKRAGLLVVSVWVLMIVAADSSIFEGLSVPLVSITSRDGSAPAVRLVVRVGAISAVNNHGTVTSIIVTHASAVRAVDRDLIVVGAQAMAVSVGVI